MYKISFYLLLLFCFVSCQNTPDPTVSTPEDKKPIKTKDNTLIKRAFVGASAQYSLAANELLVFEIDDNKIKGKSYTSFVQGEDFVNPNQADTFRAFVGTLKPDQTFSFKVNYNDSEYAFFRGKLDAKNLLETTIAGKYKDPMTGSLKAFNDVYFFDEIIDGKIVKNPRLIEDQFFKRNDFAKLKSNIAYPRLMQYPNPKVPDVYNFAVQNKLANIFTNVLEYGAGDHEAPKTTWNKLYSETYDVKMLEDNKISWQGLLYLENPNQAQIPVFVVTFNYDFKNQKVLLLKDFLGKKNLKLIKNKALAQVKDESAKRAISNWQDDEFLDWAVDKTHLYLYPIEFGTLTGYHVAKAGLPTVKIPLKDLK